VRARCFHRIERGAVLADNSVSRRTAVRAGSPGRDGRDDYHDRDRIGPTACWRQNGLPRSNTGCDGATCRERAEGGPGRQGSTREKARDTSRR
jgi:hypothetical protein